MSVKPTLLELILNATAAGKSMLAAANAAAQKTLLSLVKGDVGLGNVDNTSDANKPVSTAQQTAIDAKIGGSVGSTTNRLVKSSGTGGATVQASGITVDSSNNVSGVGTFASGAITASGNLIVNSISAGSRSYKVCIGTYGTVSETGGGLAYITGNSVSANTVDNQIVKTSDDVGHFIRMRYDQGISFHTGITGSTGAVSSDRDNQRLIIDGNGLATFSRAVVVGVFTFATVPAASSNTGGEIRISDRAQRRAYSDGTNWRFIADDAIIS